MRYFIFILKKQHLSFLLLILLLSCSSSGGGNGDKGTAPLISDLAFYLYVDENSDTWIEQNNFDIGDLVTWKLWVADPDLDISFWHITIFRKVNGGYEQYEGPIVSEMLSQTASKLWYYRATPWEVNYPSGTYRFEIQVEDQKRNMSNTFIAHFIIN